MTTQQQFIIESLQKEFERINAAQVTKTKFNLINSESLQEDTKRKKEWAELSKRDLETWDKAAHEEANRIIELLREDLPPYVIVEKYTPAIGKYEAAQFQIRHESVSFRAHHEELVSIEVYVSREYRRDEHGNAAEFGKAFRYVPYPIQYGSIPNYKKGYKTIEEAVNDSQFKEALRKRVIR